MLEGRLRQALARLNPDLPPDALEDAFRKLTRADAPSLIERNRAVHRMLVEGVTVEYRRQDGSIAGAQARVIDFDDARQQRLARGQPVHRRRGPAHPPAGRRAVRQRPAAGRDRAEEPRRRERDRSGRRSSSSRPTRRRSRRCSRPTRCWSSPTACRRASARSAPARSGSSPGARSTARGRCADSIAELQVMLEGRVRAAPVPRPGAPLHRVRGRTAAAQLVKKMAGLPPVPRRQRGGGGDAARRALATRRWQMRPVRAGRSRAASRRPARRRRLAHAGLRQEPDDGVLRRAGDPAPGDGEPDDRRAHRPQRPRRPALRHLRPLPRPAAPDRRCRPQTAPTCARSSPSPRAASCSRRSRSSSPRRRATGIRCCRTAATSS